MDSIASREKMCPFDIMTEKENRSLTDKFMLRLPDGMRERIKASADANNRSMNAEIVSRLDDSLDAHEHVASISLNIALSEIDTAEFKEKLGLLVEYLKEFQLKAPQPALEQDSDAVPAGGSEGQ